MNSLKAIVRTLKVWNGLKTNLSFRSNLCKVVIYYKVSCKRKAKEGKVVENMLKVIMRLHKEIYRKMLGDITICIF